MKEIQSKKYKVKVLKADLIEHPPVNQEEEENNLIIDKKKKKIYQLGIWVDNVDLYDVE